MTRKILTICKVFVCFVLIFCVCFYANDHSIAYADSLVERVANKAQEDDRKVYLGGQIVGFEIGLNGVMIESFSEVDTAGGFLTLNSGLMVGDLIYAIDGKQVNDASELVAILNNGRNKSEFVFTVGRNNNVLNLKVCPLIDRISGEYKLGINVLADICAGAGGRCGGEAWRGVRGIARGHLGCKHTRTVAL